MNDVKTQTDVDPQTIDTCHNCHLYTDRPHFHVMMNYNFTKKLYEFALCPLCDEVEAALEQGLSLKEYLEVFVPAGYARDLANGMITKQDHDTWLAGNAVIIAQAIERGVYA